MGDTNCQIGRNFNCQTNVNFKQFVIDCKPDLFVIYICNNGIYTKKSKRN